jgi:hypothetical protein
VPLVPVPEAPDVITSHAASDVALQPQVSPFVETETLPLPPAESKLADAGLSATSQPAAACVTTCVWPFAVIVAVRDAATVFAATVYAIVPLVPVPEAPDVITSQPASEVALQPQVSPFVETETLPLPPAESKLADAGLSATSQPAAACVTTCVWPFAVIVAVRDAATVFAATVYAIVPDVPVPEAPLVITSQEASLEADHVQVSPLVVTLTEPLPPAESKLAVAGLSATSQPAAA